MPRPFPLPTLLLSCLLALLAACEPQAPEEADANAYPALDLPEQPNVLWLVAEDMSPYLAAFGDSTIETPNLDRLMREGVLFTNVYSVAGVCAPSRFALATGVYPIAGGGHNMRTQYNAEILAEVGLEPYEAVPDPDVRLMSEVLREHGYYATNNAKTDYQFAIPLMAWDESSNQAHWRNRPDPNQPFFSIFNYGVTHESRIWAKADDSLWVAADLDVPIPPYLPDTEPVRRDVRRMYSNIKEMDAQIGERLAELEADGLLDETIIVWYTDHGGPLPRQKRLLYDSGLHVPMIVRFPGAQHGGRVDSQLVSFVDFAPTTFSLVGIEPPGYLHGQAVLGPYAQPPRTYVFAASDRLDEHYDRIRAARDDRFKYLRNYHAERGYYLPVAYREQMATMQELLRLRDAGGLDSLQAQWFRATKPEEELFDTRRDEHELRNLAGDPTYAETLQRLRAALDAHLERVGDLGSVPEEELVERFWPGGEQPVTESPVATVEGGQADLASTTEGASIGYQLLAPGDTLTGSWIVYTEPVPLRDGQQLVAVADRIGYAPSDTVRVTP